MLTMQPTTCARTAAILLLILAGKGPSPAPGAQAPGKKPPKTRPATASVVLTPIRKATLSAGISATVLKIRKRMGDTCSRGTPLVELDRQVYDARVSKAKAELAASRARLEQTRELARKRTIVRKAEAVLTAARANADATRTLYRQKQASKRDLAKAQRDAVIAETELELARSRLAMDMAEARKAVATAQSMLTLAMRNLDACTIRAPYTGKVSRVLVHEHENVEPGTPVLEFVDDHVLLARFILPSRLFSRVHVNDRIRITLETGVAVTAVIHRISPTLEPASRTFEVIAQIDNRKGRLRAGMNGTVKVGEDHE